MVWFRAVVGVTRQLSWLTRVRVTGALQLLMNRYGEIRFAQVPERVSTKSFVVLIIGNSKSFHLGAQGTLRGNPT